MTGSEITGGCPKVLSGNKDCLGAKAQRMLHDDNTIEDGKNVLE